jgi:predicted flap endonuclease-1-like 5' DNA nuclease
MNEQEFRRFLKRKGKKPHVVENLIKQVEQFTEYLVQERGQGLDDADAQDLEDYVAALEALKPGEARKRVRGLALYYQFTGNAAMASLAAAVREEAVAKTRRPFALKDFRGVNPQHIAKLNSIGILNVEHMLDAAKTPESRQRLADETGVPLDAILELAKLSDLSRIAGVKGIRARLYYDAGVDTLEKIAQWEPEALRAMLIEFVERTGFDGIAPLPKEIQFTVMTASKLPRIIQY